MAAATVRNEYPRVTCRLGHEWTQTVVRDMGAYFIVSGDTCPQCGSPAGEAPKPIDATELADMAWEFIEGFPNVTAQQILDFACHVQAYRQDADGSPLYGIAVRGDYRLTPTQRREIVEDCLRMVAGMAGSPLAEALSERLRQLL